MSVRVMGWVWQSSRSKGTDRLVLLAIADCAGDDGGNAYPSMAALKAKTGLSERAIHYALNRLSDLGELKVQLNKGPRGCNRYRIVMTETRGAPDAPPHQMHPAPDAPLPPQEMHPRVHQMHPTPAPDAPGTVLEPSVEPTHPPSVGGARAKTRGTRIPDDFAVTPAMVTWARANVPDVDGRLATAKFLDHWQAATGTNATKRDWTAAWRNWMRNEADRRPPGRASPARGQRVERNGMHLRPDTAAEFDDIARWDAMDAQQANGQLALGGPG